MMRQVSIEMPSEVSLTDVYWFRADSLTGGTWAVGAPFFASGGFARELWDYYKWIARKTGKRDLKMRLSRVDLGGWNVVGYFDAALPAQSYDPPGAA
jgi:hypothetical protein